MIKVVIFVGFSFHFILLLIEKRCSINYLSAIRGLAVDASIFTWVDLNCILGFRTSTEICWCWLCSFIIIAFEVFGWKWCGNYSLSYSFGIVSFFVFLMYKSRSSETYSFWCCAFWGLHNMSSSWGKVPYPLYEHESFFFFLFCRAHGWEVFKESQYGSVFILWLLFTIME